MGQPRDDGYLLDNRHTLAGRRLDALSELFDPWTLRHVEALGIAPGWHCWEVGAGGPSVVRWLAAQVGPGGRVLATDIDLAWVEHLTGPPVEVRRHDLVADVPPDESFDLVHARLVLVHLADRAAALGALVGAVRPGGWLLVEDADPALQPLSCLDPQSPEEELANRLRTGFRSLLSGRRADLAYGRTLPRLLRRAGLVDVAADAYFPVELPACIELEVTTMAMIRVDLVRHGIASDEEIDGHVAAARAGRLDLTQPPMISAWGRAPGP